MNIIHKASLSRLPLLFLLWSLTAPLSAATLSDLRRDAQLTPQRFARYFADFSYKFHAEVQPAEAFLATQSGDCDDYATLAAEILREKGYTTRLIAVRMRTQAHVVCYVEETKSYLDYNNRSYLVRTVSSGGSIRDIARKVAKSFDAEWTSASEFTFRSGVKRLGNTIPEAGRSVPRPVRLAQSAAPEPPMTF
ncbi:MAG: transglutaminase domain-containing protein [Chloroflexi bacterium]|nr:transglutaminase domain-containing protein [Chloroflexota bacterium]